MNLRFILRQFWKSPGFTCVAVLSLALGIGANTAIFSVMDALLLRKLPVKQADELVFFGNGISGGIFNPFPNGNNTDLYSVPFFREVQRDNTVFAGVAAVESMPAEPHARIANAADVEALSIRLVSGNFFELLGVEAALGRVLTPEDDVKPGAHPVVVLSDAFWQRRFARDPKVIGRTFSFNGMVFTIVGVGARNFAGTNVGESADAWIPLSMFAQSMPWVQAPWEPLSQSLWLIGRLRTGVGIETAQTNANLIFQQWLHQVAGPSPSRERLADMRKARFQLTPAAYGMSRMRRQYELALRILMVLVGIVLLSACSNVASLMLARGESRRREVAVRLALGASRRKLASQFLVESLLLGLASGCFGLLIAWWGGELLLSMVSREQVALAVGPNLRVVLFTVGLSVLTGLLFGLAPALRMTRVELGPALKEGKGTASASPRNRVAMGLVAGQVALALFLTISAGLFIATFGNLERMDPGFDKGHVVAIGLDTNWNSLNHAAWLNVSRRLEARVKSLPGVESASFALVTFNSGSWRSPMWPAGVEHTRANQRDFQGNRVGAEYFRTMGMPIVAGRGFSERDTNQSQHVAIVNQTLAHEMYGDEPALGKRFSFGGRDKYDFEIVGVVKDARYNSLREKAQGMWFLYAEQEPELAETLVVRTIGNPAALMASLRGAIRAEAPNIAVGEMSTLDTMVKDSINRESLLARLASVFGALALSLASIGLYGVMAYSVARRTNEIGIRMALGAQPGSVLAMVLRESFVVVGVGLVVGIPTALACGRFIENQLFGLAPNDPVMIAGATVLLMAVALIASFVPARRAAMLDPLAALREE